MSAKKSAVAVVAADLFCITEKGLAVVAKTEQLTAQRTEKGLGANWRTTAKLAPNTRAVCLQAMASGLESGFTLAQLQAYLAANKETLLPASASVGGRIAAFLKEGYIAAVA